MNNKTNTHVQVIVTLALLTAHVKTLGNTKYGWGAGGGGSERETNAANDATVTKAQGAPTDLLPTLTLQDQKEDSYYSEGLISIQ